ncbi:gluconate 2-dehydrogenase subunit 3 family protein [Portibacter marinus]|uniref:gluconate 2-dehydrogenase subunit 3 family protein n=1 Tax=Portibacter marinus TaxID=2898660 RepID=UPI001F404C81|nr:gluconate 2-dehydrogenase subunit 3 family protein [Portibacter marinus]
MKRRDAIKRTGLFMGAVVILPSFGSILQSCQSEVRADWQPLFFRDEEARLISSLVDTLLPRTDTPGALDVNADIFIDKVVYGTNTEEGQQALRAEMATFNQECVRNYGAVFADLSNGDKVQAMMREETKAPKFNSAVWGTAVGKQEPVGFYRSMKSITLWAYLTSEKIGKEVLNYDPIPGEYVGCVPLSEVGNAWSL